MICECLWIVEWLITTKPDLARSLSMSDAGESGRAEKTIRTPSEVSCFANSPSSPIPVTHRSGNAGRGSVKLQGISETIIPSDSGEPTTITGANQ